MGNSHQIKVVQNSGMIYHGTLKKEGDKWVAVFFQRTLEASGCIEKIFDKVQSVYPESRITYTRSPRC